MSTKRSRGAAPAKPRDGRAALPSMTALLTETELDPRFGGEAPAAVADALRTAVGEARDDARTGAARETAAILERAAGLLAERRSERLTRVINATGVVLHTGLGRAPLAEIAMRAIRETAPGYCNLEFDLKEGTRGRRGQDVERLLRDLTGGEAALVVNNGAAATMLVLAGLARGREVIVSRGQLIEIGGSFRLPEVMAAGGAVLREVGTTNKTRLSDYERAIGERTALLMRVHASNYRIVGFAESPGTAELARLAHGRGLPLYDDLGSGALRDDELWKAAGEPTVSGSLRAGADVVSFSGDKLLGGPQAGLIVGRKEIVERLRAEPMARALRVDKMTLAALGATLELYLDSQAASREIPVLQHLGAGAEALQARAERLRAALAEACPEERFDTEQEESFAGGGSLPARPMPTWVVRWRPSRISSTEAARRLRLCAPPVVARVAHDAVLFDARTLNDEDVSELWAAVQSACR